MTKLPINFSKNFSNYFCKRRRVDQSDVLRSKIKQLSGEIMYGQFGEQDHPMKPADEMCWRCTSQLEVHRTNWTVRYSRQSVSRPVGTRSGLLKAGWFFSLSRKISWISRGSRNVDLSRNVRWKRTCSRDETDVPHGTSRTAFGGRHMFFFSFCGAMTGSDPERDGRDRPPSKGVNEDDAVNAREWIWTRVTTRCVC